MANVKKETPSLFSALQKTSESASAVNTELVRELRLDTLETNPMNRFSMEEDAEFRSTMASIERDGLLEDVIITPAAETGRYRIVSGHRRVLAARKLGKATIPCKVREYPDKLSELRALMGANLHRRTVSPFDMARQLETLREVLRQEGKLPAGVKEQAELMAEQTQLSRATVERYLDLLNLDETLSGWAQSDQMTLTDAYELARKSNRSLYAAVEAFVEGAPDSEKADFPALVHRAIAFAKRAETDAAGTERSAESEKGGDKDALRAVDSFGRAIRRQTAAVKNLRFPGGDPANRETAKKKLDTCLANLEELKHSVETLRRELDKTE